MKDSKWLIETLAIIAAILFLITDITQIVLHDVIDNTLIFLIILWVCIIIALLYYLITRLMKLQKRDSAEK